MGVLSLQVHRSISLTVQIIYDREEVGMDFLVLYNELLLNNLPGVLRDDPSKSIQYAQESTRTMHLKNSSVQLASESSELLH